MGNTASEARFQMDATSRVQAAAALVTAEQRGKAPLLGRAERPKPGALRRPAAMQVRAALLRLAARGPLGAAVR